MLDIYLLSRLSKNFPFICSNIPLASVYGVYISQFIRYFRACGSYHNFCHRGLLFTCKLLNQSFIVLKVSTSKALRCHHTHSDLGNVPFIVIKSRSFPHSWLITGFVTRVTQQVSHVEQELLTLPEHPSSLSVFFVLVWFVLFILSNYMSSRF